MYVYLVLSKLNNLFQNINTFSKQILFNYFFSKSQNSLRRCQLLKAAREQKMSKSALPLVHYLHRLKVSLTPFQSILTNEYLSTIYTS